MRPAARCEPLAHEYVVRLNRFLTVFPVRFKHWMVMPMSILDVIVVGCRPRATLTECCPPSPSFPPSYAARVYLDLQRCQLIFLGKKWLWLLVAWRP